MFRVDVSGSDWSVDRSRYSIVIPSEVLTTGGGSDSWSNNFSSVGQRIHKSWISSSEGDKGEKNDSLW